MFIVVFGVAMIVVGVIGIIATSSLVIIDFLDKLDDEGEDRNGTGKGKENRQS